MKRPAGFTLIELLLALAIIGIISAIAIPVLLGQRSRARDKAAMANACSVATDLVAGYDKAKEGNAVMTDVASFTAAVLGSATSPLVPSYWSSVNPWAPAETAFSALVLETAATGPATLAAATAASQGQVHIGFFPSISGASGAIVTAVYLNASFVTGAGTASHVFTTFNSVN